ncbi:MAG TPA: MFS transporter [Candidatus Limnocylindrales bacterium]|nr:MFS transporter [Candidatus Limnocylindrales bacterium]
MTQPATDVGGAMHTEGRGRWLGLAMLSLGVSMIIVDATIVNVAVPSIIKELKLDSTTAEWINTVYALVFAALLVTLGRVGDLVGRRVLYLVGLGVFGVASVLAGAAPTGELLIAARVLQGVGGAMILPSTQSILNTNFRGRDRAIAFGIWGATIGGMAAIGPLLGGWLTTSFSWRWAFFINVPVAIIAVLGTLKYIKESKDENAKFGLDPVGFLLITFGLGAFVFGLIEGRSYGWWTPERPFTIFGWTWPLESISIIPFLLFGGILALALFLWVEQRRSKAGKFFLFDVDLWRFPAFRYGNLAGTIVSLGEFGLLFALPLFLQAVIGYSAFETGLVFLSLAVGAFFAAPLAARFSHMWGPRRVVTLGMGLEAVGIIVTSLLISTSVTGLMLALPLFVYGIGVGFATAQLTSIVLSDIPPERSGLASGANSTMRQVGSAMGIAILGTVLFVGLVSGTSTNVSAAIPEMAPACVDLVTTIVDESAGQVLPALKNPISAAAGADLGGNLGTLPPEQAACFRDPAFIAALPQTVVPIETAFVDATRLAGFVASGFVLVGVVLSLLLPEMPKRLEDDHQPVEPMDPDAEGAAA